MTTKTKTTDIFPSPGLYHGIDSIDYFAVGLNRDKMEDSVLSKSMLWAFAKNPRRWLNAPPFEGNKATQWGSLIDVMLLTPDEFSSTYAVTPQTYPHKAAKKGSPTEQKPWNGNSTYCKEWVTKQDGKEIISFKMLLEANKALDALKANDVANYMVNNGDSQVAMVATLMCEEKEVTIKGLADLIPKAGSDYGNALVDLKTTAKMDSPSDLIYAVWRNGWFMQAALYLDLYNSVRPENEPERTDFWFIVQQSSAPYEVVVAPLAADAIMLGREMYQQAIKAWVEASTMGNWFSPFDQIEELDLPERAYNNPTMP